MNNLYNKIKKSVTTFLVLSFLATSNVVAQSSGAQVIKVGGVDNLLASILKTIQFYFPFVAAVVIAVLGFKLATSGDDSSTKAEAKRNLIAVALGSVLIYGATFIATSLTGIAQ